MRDSWEYLPVARVGDVPEGQGKLVRAGPREIALFLVDGEYRAIKNPCPHEAEDLWRGRIREGSITCPNHGWRFDLQTGKCTRGGDRDARVFPVKVEGDVILVGV